MSATTLKAVFALSQTATANVGEERIGLLEAIRDHGSLAAAGRALGLSYKSVWEAVNTLNNLFARPLVSARSGGRHGGGAQLTPEGEELIRSFHLLQAELARCLAVIEQRLGRSGSSFQPSPSSPLWRLMMKTSARNALRCVVDQINAGAVNAEVLLHLSDGVQLSVIITQRSVQELGLTPGLEVTALIKSSFVILTPADQALKTSARNRLCGTVTLREDGAVNSEITLDIGGGKTITAIVTKDSADSLALQTGSRACALVKASHIILVVD